MIIDTKTNFPAAAGGLILIVLLTVLCLWGCPRYSVYSKSKEGEAELARASYNRQVRVLEAKATMEAATLLGQADSIRAIGVAASNRIIAQSISPEYLQWKWIDEISKTSNQIIYVPGGNLGLPILEANRFKPPVIKEP